MKNPYAQYQDVTVVGKDQLELTIMLYDGAIAFLHQARHHIDNNNIEQSHDFLTKAKRIVTYLISTTDLQNIPPDGRELATNLLRLYAFCYERIGTANLTKDAAEVDNAINVLNTLREGWIELKASGTWTPPEDGVSQIDEHLLELGQA